MAFSKAVLLVVFAFLLISADVSAHRDLAEITTDVRGAPGGNGGRVECHRFSNPPCLPARRTPVDVSCINNPNNRSCYRGGGNGGKGGRGGHGPPETRN